MREVIVRDNYTVDTISKSNSKAWEVLLGILNESTDDTMFDFKGIEVLEPWRNEMFNKFLGDERVHMRLYSSPKTAYTINMACKIGKLKTDRVENVDIVAPPTMSKEEKTMLVNAEKLQDYFIAEGDTAVLEVYKWVDQIGKLESVSAIQKAVEIYSERTGIKNIILDLDAMFIQKNVIEAIASSIGELFSKGINFNVVCKDEDIMSKISIYQHPSSSKQYTDEDRYNLAKEYLRPKTVGMLVKYKSSRAVDEFGRHGNGEPVNCRVAIFLGFVETNEGMACKFRVYNGNTFYPQEHWALEHDGEQLTHLESEDLSILMKDIGIAELFIGSRYHFMAPIQCDTDNYTVIYSMDANHKIVYTKASIPLRIKIVLDDWGIEYDESSLVHAITETERQLEKLDNE